MFKMKIEYYCTIIFNLMVDQIRKKYVSLKFDQHNVKFSTFG